MKEQDITPKIIELAREIARLWRMEIYVGCWVYIRNRLRLTAYVCDEHYYARDGRDNAKWGRWEISKGIPIPSISDCEQKLIELGYESINLRRRPFPNPWMANVWDAESHNLDADTIKAWERMGKNLHEVALSTLLEVLKNE